MRPFELLILQCTFVKLNILGFMKENEDKLLEFVFVFSFVGNSKLLG